MERPLTLYPVNTPAGSGWIGLSRNRVCWLSLGPLDEAAVERYWIGRVKKGKHCPIPVSRIAGAAKGNDKLELAPRGTPFQQAVWDELVRIPFGARMTYGEIAEKLEFPRKARAVGTAVGANPIAWLIPCHRVVPSSGGTGSYRWGPDAKKRLLDWELSQTGQPDGGRHCP